MVFSSPYIIIEQSVSKQWRPWLDAAITFEIYALCWTAKFTLRKCHTVKNWYQFLTTCDKLVPIRYVFHINSSHFVKNAHVVKVCVAYVGILHVDKILPKSAFIRQFGPLFFRTYDLHDHVWCNQNVCAFAYLNVDFSISIGESRGGSGGSL